ncbi:MAG: hypothetical protein LQ346_001695 [Caloplaca aetnensis]|nr:MAG: hypothetical protein LQ346_001695 [Caloplaca aetnensis]
MVDESEDEYLVPLQDQRAFGAGIRRTQINFVSPRGPRSLQLGAPKPGAGDRYLAIVLDQNGGNEGAKELQPDNVQQRSGDSKSGVQKLGGQAVCEICNLPILADAVALDRLETTDIKPHEASLVHQVCLKHSHPPSHLDRNRQGLKYLSSYGWDPDSRQGLGATGTGIRDPIKANPKNNTLGVGAMALAPANKVTKLPPKKLDAKKVREAEVKGWKDRERLRNMFYQSDEVDKYLGSSG